jgi:hypothetical protein
VLVVDDGNSSCHVSIGNVDSWFAAEIDFGGMLERRVDSPTYCVSIGGTSDTSTDGAVQGAASSLLACANADAVHRNAALVTALPNGRAFAAVFENELRLPVRNVYGSL